ncbi:MAG: hypothetical protein E4H02_08190 [Lentisphaerales bacterium]|jgi:hypothetical protein|nr:MAG: hypothetical protein E4H02_08190 [Lentisphaerales bacterium]
MNITNQNKSNNSSSTHLADFDGVSIAPDEERPFVPKVDKWSARWVWLNTSVYPDRQKCSATTFCTSDFPFTIALIRKTFDLPFTPTRATAWISGDTKYRCWVNGTPVARGPAEVGGDYANRESPDWWFYEGIELKDNLRRGRNVITADVMLGPQVQADYSMGRGGFLLELAVEGEGAERLALCTDDTWRATLSHAETQPGTYDARKEFYGWKDADFDDSVWPCTDIVGTVEQSPWNLLPREIPMLAETRIPPVAVAFEDRPALDNVFPLTMGPGCPQTFRLQFPREVAGHIFLDMEGGEGTHVDLDFRELPDVPGKQETVILPGHRWSYQSRSLHGFEYLQVTVTVLDGAQCKEPLTIHAIDAVFTSFPVEYRGYFKCSDPLLNQLWDVGRWTTQLCMQSYHLDSPIHQEGLGCTGDYMIESLISYCCFGEARLARKDILRTAYLLKQKQGRMFHTSYSLLWVWMVMDYMMYSGDLETVHMVMAEIHDLLDLFDSYIGSIGLITKAPNYMFMDWVGVGGFSLHHPPGSMGQGYMSAFYFRALRYGAELSRLCGDESRAQVYNRRATALKSAFNQHLWSRERGLYRDGVPGTTEAAPGKWLPVDSKEESFTVHTNAVAVAVGIAPPESRQTIMRKVLGNDSLPLVQPYFMHYVFEALAEAGLFEEYAFDIMYRWKELLKEHPSSLKEMWDGGDYSHAWGGTPAYQLSTRVLGISSRKPGFHALSLSPCLGPLRMARGAIPTPHGPIQAAWHMDGNSLTGSFCGPRGSEVSLRTKGADFTRTSIRQDGQPIRELKTEEGGLCWTLNGGEYIIKIVTEQSPAVTS